MKDHQFRAAIRKFIQEHGSDKIAKTIGVTKPTVDGWSQGRNLAHPVMREAVLTACGYVDKSVMHVPKE